MPWKRQSIVRFNGVDSSTIVQPLPQFVSVSCPAKYMPVTQQEHIEAQMKQATENLKLVN